MNVEIVSERVNPLLHRTELQCVLDYAKETPSRKELIQYVAQKKGVKENLVIIDEIKQEYGWKKSKAYVKVYDSEKAVAGIEKKHLVERSKKALAKEDVKEEAPAEAPVEKVEAPTEKTEETPAEEEKKEE